MINKHSIYNWLFFPLFVSLLAGSVASCINDPAMEEEDTSGKSTLSIMVRGITITPGTDDYVETLRVIGYDNTGAVVCNQKYSGAELGKVEGTVPDTYIKITQTLEDAFQEVYVISILLRMKTGILYIIVKRLLNKHYLLSWVIKQKMLPKK